MSEHLCSTPISVYRSLTVGGQTPYRWLLTFSARPDEIALLRFHGMSSSLRRIPYGKKKHSGQCDCIRSDVKSFAVYPPSSYGASMYSWQLNSAVKSARQNWPLGRHCWNFLLGVRVSYENDKLVTCPALTVVQFVWTTDTSREQKGNKPVKWENP